jgi:putative transposase
MPQIFWEYRPPLNRRLDPIVYTTVGQPVFFTVRTAVGTEPFAQSRYAHIVVECLLEQRRKSSCELDVFCVMPDHLHLVVTPARDGASSLLYVDRFKGWCGRCLRLAGWSGPLWQPRSYDHAVRRDEDLRAIAEYILHNPVRKGLCTLPDEYPWAGIPDMLFAT